MKNELIARELVNMVNEADDMCMLDLRSGGDGDPGEILIEILTNFLNNGKITINIIDDVID